MSFKPTLAVNADFGKIKYPVYASPKLDGIRCSIVDGQALSRTLKPIPNKHIFGQLSNSRLTGLDGELIVGSPTSKSCYTESVSNVMAFDKVPEFTYFVFDLHTQARPFRERRQIMLDTLGNGSWGAFPQICLLEQNLLSNEDEMLEYESSKVEEGYEGIILRSPDAPYKFGRSTVKEGFLLKVKRFEDSEASVIEVIEEMYNGNEATVNELGRTKRSTHQENKVGKGRMGALLVRDLTTGVEFQVGTGFNDADRAKWWECRDDKYFPIIKYKFFPVGVKDKPRHPVFLGLRPKEDM